MRARARGGLLSPVASAHRAAGIARAAPDVLDRPLSAELSMKHKVALTGIKPSGTPHIGNWLGAIRPGLELANMPGTQAVYFIADYHALISVHEAAALRHMTYDVAATWLALGLDPARTLIYRQSDIPEILELSWILACFTTKGWMNKAHAYKAVVERNQTEGLEDVDVGVNIGLYTYPVLMAADILLFDTDRVPVGKDQVQHIEIARDIATRVNHLYGEVLTLPEAHTSDTVAVIPGLDGRKMSKSYDNVIGLFLPPKQLRKVINRIVTDSTPPEAPKDPESSHIFQIYRAVASEEQARALAERYRSGIGWGEAKAALFDVLDAALGPARERYTALMADTAQIDRVLADGAARARVIARATLSRVRAAIGVGTPG
jgi:tryptophanyl-tRNA synthetase